MALTLSSDESTLRVGPLVNLAPLVLTLECDPAPIFLKSGFQLEDFLDPDHRVPFLQTSRLLQNCVDATRCDHLGLLLGQQANPSHLGITGFLVRTAPDAKTALKALIEHLDLHDEGGVAALKVGPSYSTLNYCIHLPNTSAIEQIYDLSATMMYKILRVICGKNWSAESIALQRRMPHDPTPYERYFHTMLYFDSTECAITFQSQWLQHSQASADKLLYDHLEKEAEMQHEAHKQELTDKLPAVLRRALLTGQFSKSQVADNLGLHERTLQRRLKASGTSYRQELDTARKSASEELLGSTSLPICDIASTLGYSDSSTFIRAFQRWYGTNPSSWRKQFAGGRSG